MSIRRRKARDWTEEDVLQHRAGRLDVSIRPASGTWCISSSAGPGCYEVSGSRLRVPRGTTAREAAEGTLLELTYESSATRGRWSAQLRRPV
jgi:hypothetical protein